MVANADGSNVRPLDRADPGGVERLVARQPPRGGRGEHAGWRQVHDLQPRRDAAGRRSRSKGSWSTSRGGRRPSSSSRDNGAGRTGCMSSGSTARQRGRSCRSRQSTPTGSQPVVSPDGSEIAYTKWGDSPMIHIVDIDSGDDRKVQYDGANEGDGWPTAWSPDGTQLVFTPLERHREPPGRRLGRRRARSSRWGRPSRTSPNGAIGLFSPDGRQVVARYGQRSGDDLAAGHSRRCRRAGPDRRSPDRQPGSGSAP